jgi:predicted thioesterase
MKPTLLVGNRATVTINVTHDMRPAFDGVVVHDVCSTWHMAHHMEVAARKVLASHLEEGEEGIGSHLSIDHLAPAPVGCTIQVQAVAVELDDSTLVCTLEARHGDTLLATGRQVQRILPDAALKDIMDRAQARSGAPDA